MKSSPQNLVEKIVQRFAVDLPPGQAVHSGAYLMVEPAHILTHDNTGAILKKFSVIGATRVANPRQPVFALDHNVQDTSPENLAKYRKIEDFARSMGVDFYPAGRGIGHQIMLEEGYALPGTLAVASDSHANMYGGIGCLGTPVVRTDAAAIWATGKTWWQIPPVTRIVLTGALPAGCSGKDVILNLIGHFHQDEVLNHALEFTGEGVATLSVDDRLTIANMTTEWGALAGLFPVDDRVHEWIEERIRRKGPGHPRWNESVRSRLKNAPQADAGAVYAQEIRLDLGSVQPVVSGPDQVKRTTPVSQLERQRIRISKAYLVSCVNSRASDLAAAAEVMKGHKVASGVELYIAPASRDVQKDSEKKGDWHILLAAGGRTLPPGCGPCIGMGAGLLQEGEVGISATNRNFKGRMGSRQAVAYLASPVVVAASAIKGYIAAPDTFHRGPLRAELKKIESAGTGTREVHLLPGFPSQLSGRLVFCPRDNLNTDGIYPGKYTYRDDFTLEQQAEVVMENYDPEFRRIVQPGDILAAGFNFGTGSSREQAATALQARGIQLVLAGSLSQTYKRNALNNSYLVLEVPALIRRLKSIFPDDRTTIVTDSTVTVDFEQSRVQFQDETYPFAPLGPAAQELILEGGLETWVKHRLKDERQP
ncbi:MAG: homoaconitase [Candidatus Neomarinimicrobiota bacterium]|nr:MAG: homoaconitase [Candidatus Neomarinimicrobiota bacterium]